MVASECFPLVKTGGLADVVGALPRALRPFDCRARVMLPAYSSMTKQLRDPTVIGAVDDLFGGPAKMVAGRSETELDIIAVEAPHLYERPGNPYIGADGRDWPDNHLRFAALCRAAARFAASAPDGWRVDVLHCHDWQAGLTPIYLSEEMGAAAPPVVFTIHNIAFAGLCDATERARLGLPASGFAIDGYEYWGQISFLKAGLIFSDRLTTVSPTYAKELQTPAFGMGFEGILRERAADLTGILNGVDEAVWNPETDKFIAASYSARSLASKKLNRAAAQKRMQLDADPQSLLACVVSRLTQQKGIDLLAETVPSLIDRGCQLAVLGTGDPELETILEAAMRDHPGRVGVRIAYDEPLSHLLLAGSDAILVPSRFEPSGLTQLYGLRYGTIPIVARTGGLADSVIDANLAAVTAGVATGIVFAPTDADGLRQAYERATELFSNRTAWHDLIAAAMNQSVGWQRSASRYATLYGETVRKRRHTVPR